MKFGTFASSSLPFQFILIYATPRIPCAEWITNMLLKLTVKRSNLILDFIISFAVRVQTEFARHYYAATFQHILWNVCFRFVLRILHSRSEKAVFRFLDVFCTLCCKLTEPHTTESVRIVRPDYSSTEKMKKKLKQKLNTTRARARTHTHTLLLNSRWNFIQQLLTYLPSWISFKCEK